MQAPDDEGDGGDQEQGQGFRVELLRSYAEFAKRAIRSHWLLSVFILLFGSGLAITAAIYWPRTFSCTTVLMPVGNSLLDGKGTPPLLVGAESIILRHENLEGIIRDVDLVHKNAARKPAILRLKERILRSIVTVPSDEKTQTAMLVATLEAKITVSTDKSDLTIKAEWSDAQLAAELAEAARESFVRARHTAEMSAFEDKMAIYNEHATKLRSDIAVFADQLTQSREDRVKQVQGERVARGKVTPPDGDDKPRVRSVVVVPHAPVADAQLPGLKDQLDGLKKKLADLVADHDRRLREAQSRYEDLKVHLTASHPDVLAQSERIARLQGVPTDIALLRAEVKDLEGTIAQREGYARGGSSTTSTVVGGGSSARGGAEALPKEITELLAKDDGDPALVAQLQSAISTYAGMRSELLSTRIDLDTAQAAFNHRYQVIIPAEAASKPDKPKPTMIVIIGFVLSLLIGAIVPLALELKKGVLSERWQVEHQLPVLAELRLPPHTGD
jgi:capsular polysaccharide biosynthesis protein